ncbi:fructose-2,6-bisphosphatase-like protein [Trypanosoma brucei gambiense DAL972]|uniref:Fructose-6-phosphate2-kinase, putative n=1 Tax=Trypanosoma brucei gambiense (strain MHOM/CI/86/DAL972) TaxID=679716 RepID=D0A2H6_TRYB9|nr:fructose-2,6-bisphosphatase-like protein [Trypanosoma brucei gambiense DAL972]CBH15470.1 fructose-2,6-bisphosphatase-like protein [Trypanosoma brucei gambiense DAL972]|eukprot:XP_011777734.1 fructose-2,6-bisphosphatase-like protein [Trypanosoma brucei gambiense DAL972]
MTQSTIPLQSNIKISDRLEENSIDFCRFVGPFNRADEYAFTAPPWCQREGSENVPGSGLSTSVSAVFVLVSSPPNCGLVARFFCTKLLHYLLWCYKDAAFFLAGPSPRDFNVYRHEDDAAAWKKCMETCLAKSLEHVESARKRGTLTEPVVIVLADCESQAAYDTVHKMLGSMENLFVRHIWFGDGWRESNPVDCSYINVCLRQPAYRLTKCRGSSTCAKITSYLNSCLPTLHHIHLHEPLSGSPEETLRSGCPLFFTRHGQSEYNLEDRLGGDPDITPLGVDDALTLAEFFRDQVVRNPRLFATRDSIWDETEGFEVWCSQLKRTRHTAQPSADVLTNGNLKAFKMLNEIHAGVCEDMTANEVKEQYPSIQFFRHTDKAGFRYPNGESYHDLKRRLVPILYDLNATRKGILVVAHQAVLRAILSFFGGPPVEEAVHKPCAHRAVWCCTYNRLGEPRLSTITLRPRLQSSTEASTSVG